MGDVMKVAVRDQVTHISGTPTFFRFLLGAASPQELGRIPVRQITLGGEIVDQAILDALCKQFPTAALTHIYASSEMGVCFSVQDGRAGFPTEYVDRSDLPTRIKIVEGQLYVSSPHRLRRYLGAQLFDYEADMLFPTGDFVELRDGRYHFIGRGEHIINVGGYKVATSEVEAVLLQVPGVHLVKVTGGKSSLVGQIVQADVVLHPGYEVSQVRRLLFETCKARLEPHKRPRITNFVRELELSGGVKIRRTRT
jgi:acyl-coenzyme A synthetase/AMP-(fatty) acid ligase